MSQDHSGGCHCGALRYRVQATLDDVAHCHCSICRRCSGGTITTWATVPLDGFTWTQGKPRSYHSSATCTRYFCPNCGHNWRSSPRAARTASISPSPRWMIRNRSPSVGISGSAHACPGCTWIRSCRKSARRTIRSPWPPRAGQSRLWRGAARATGQPGPGYWPHRPPVRPVAAAPAGGGFPRPDGR